MSDILTKNLECIKKYNKDLAKKIADVSSLSVPIELCKTQKDEHNIMINGVYVHSIVDAEKEAQQIYNALPHNEDYSVHVTFGLGLGYLFQELCDHAKGSIILYEENIELLRAVFEIVDFSSSLSKNNVRISTNLNELKDSYYHFFTPQTKISLTFLNYYKNNFSTTLSKVLKELELSQGIAQGSYRFKTEKSKFLVNNFIDKLDIKLKTPCVRILENKFKNLPAIVVSAGASLYDNIDLIREYQNKAIIFCVGTAYKVLRRNGIKPKFVCIVEGYNVSNQVDGEITKDVNLIYEPTTHAALLDYEYRNKFIYPSKENTVNQSYMDLTNNSDLFYETKGTVAYNAMFSAYKTGCNPIILVGQDLAYVNDCCYSKNSPYASLKCRINEETKKWEIYSDNEEELIGTLLMNTTCTRKEAESAVQFRYKSMTERLIEARDKQGNLIRTDVSYILFAKYFSDFASRVSDKVTLINGTVKGLQIDNFINMNFKDALEQYTKDDIDVDAIIDNTAQSCSIDYKILDKNLEKEILAFEKNIQLVKNISSSLKDIKLQLQNKQKPLPKTKLAMRRCLDVYSDITTTNKSVIFSSLTYSSKEQINNFLNNNSQNFTLETIMQLCEMLNSYYNEINTDGIAFLHHLKKIQESMLNENTCTTC